MWRGSIVFRIFAAIVMIGILVAAGVMIFQAGQAQGYAMAVAAGGKELAPQSPAPGMPYYGAPYYAYPHFGFWPGFFFFPFGLFFFGLLFFFLIGGIFRRRMWRHDGWGPYGTQGQQPPPPGTPPAGPGQPQPPTA